VGRVILQFKLPQNGSFPTRLTRRGETLTGVTWRSASPGNRRVFSAQPWNWEKNPGDKQQSSTSQSHNEPLIDIISDANPDEKTRKTGAFVYHIFVSHDSCAFELQLLAPPIRHRDDAGLCAQAPEKAVIAGGHRGIGLSQNELAFPAQRGSTGSDDWY